MRKGLQLKRLVRVAAVSVALGTTLVVSGCGTSDVAATVNGHVITEQQVADATREINEALKPEPALTPAATLTYLVRSAVILPYADSHGFPQSESAARHLVSGLSDPSPATLEVIRTNTAMGQLGAGDEAPLSKQLQELTVDVNPKYGRYDTQQAIVGASTPDWIKFATAAQ